MTIPNCDPDETVTQVDIDKEPELVSRIRYFYTPDGSFLKFNFLNKPSQEYFLTTRRDRTRPKLFIDQNRLLADLYKRFPGLVFEANAQSPEPSSSSRPNRT